MNPRTRFVLLLTLAPSLLRAQPNPPAEKEARSGGDVASVAAVVRSVQRETSLASAEIGVSVIDVDTGHTIAEANEHTPLNPASNAKIVTAAAALSLLHPNFRYETTLSGVAKGDTVIGGLVLRGYGDPSFGASDVWDLVQKLRSHGVRRVEGDIWVDQRFFDEQATPPAFEQQPNEWSYFRAPVSAVAVNENCVTLTVRPSSSGGPAQVTFDPPGFVETEGAIATSDERNDIVLALSGGGDGRLHAKLAGAISSETHVYRETKRVEDPSLLAGYVLKDALEHAGIHATGQVRAGSVKGKVLVSHSSAALSTLTYQMGKASDNFYAEMVFKTLGGELKGRPAKFGDSSERILTWLESIGASDPGVVVKNGSGLFDANRVTTSAMTRLLRAAWRDQTIQPEFVAQLAVGGVDGTLHKRFRSERTRGLVRAKTGTLDDTIALTGYVLSKSGGSPVAFSLLFNHVTGKHDVARKAADRIIEAIARAQAH